MDWCAWLQAETFANKSGSTVGHTCFAEVDCISAHRLSSRDARSTTDRLASVVDLLSSAIH